MQTLPPNLCRGWIEREPVWSSPGISTVFPMSYATATELLIRFDSDEISQRADRMVPRLVTDEMLRMRRRWRSERLHA